MAITPNFTEQDVRSHLDAFIEAIERRQIDRLRYLGEECLVEARQNRGYMMQTGALLSSTGYQIFVDGVAVRTAFDPASGAQSSAAANGVATGRSIAEAVGKDTTGVALIVVAGMHYATYVEARGYNVLTSARQLAQRELPKMLNQLMDNIRKAAQ